MIIPKFRLGVRAVYKHMRNNSMKILLRTKKFLALAPIDFFQNIQYHYDNLL
jgi:hypothetical protein